MLKFLNVVGKGYQVLALGERALARAGATLLLEDAAAIGMRRALMTQLVEGEIGRLSLAGKALYNTGAFAAEFGGIQVWSIATVGLYMLYERVAHGKKLSWETLGAGIHQVNSWDSIEHSFINLVGLKLGGLTTHPIIGRLQSKEQLEALHKTKADVLFKTQEAFTAKLEKKIQEAEAQGIPFVMDKPLREEAQHLNGLMEEVLQGAAKLQEEKKVTIFTKEEMATWKDAQEWLSTWVLHSIIEEKAQDAFVKLDLEFANGTVVKEVNTAAGVAYEMKDNHGKRTLVDKVVFDRFEAWKMSTYKSPEHALLRETFGVDPHSPEGQALLPALSAYARTHGEGGKPMSDSELFRAAEEMNVGVKVLLKRSGFAENSKLTESLRKNLIRIVREQDLRNGEAAKIHRSPGSSPCHL